MALLDSAVVFLVSLLVGALGIHVGAALIAGVEDYSRAVWTALLGAIVWAVVAFFLGWIPGLGPLLVYLSYLAVIKARYPGGWLDAVGIALVAWVASLAVLYVLAAVGWTSFEAVGVPGA